VTSTLLAAWLAGAVALHNFSWGYLPEPLIPANNPLTAAKVALGKRLFHEPKLSVSGGHSCATCHQPEKHFTDGLVRSIGAAGGILATHTPTLYYAAFSSSLGWRDKGVETLEQQHLQPLFNADPIELGYRERNVAELNRDEAYREQFGAAFADGTISTNNIVKALASYVRTLVPPPSAFDAYLFYDDRSAMSAPAKAGMDLFFSPRLGCSGCHASLAFSGPITHTQQQAAPAFHVTGVGGSTEAFRAPTLRRISDTAPYMHDGSLATLEDVLEHYQHTDAPRVPRFRLSAVEAQQLLAFLRTL